MQRCHHCGASVADGRATCKGCGQPVSNGTIYDGTIYDQDPFQTSDGPDAPLTRVSEAPLSMEARRAILTREIHFNTANGWQLITQTDTTVTMTRKGQPDGCITLILLFIAILPGLLYYLLARPTETMVVTIGEYGEVFRTQGKS